MVCSVSDIISVEKIIKCSKSRRHEINIHIVPTALDIISFLGYRYFVSARRRILYPSSRLLSLYLFHL